MKTLLKKTVVGVACAALLATSAYAATGKSSSNGLKQWLNVVKTVPTLVTELSNSLGGDDLQALTFKRMGDTAYFESLSLVFKQNVKPQQLLSAKFTRSLLATINAAGRSECKTLPASGKFQYAAACRSSNGKTVKYYGISVKGKKVDIGTVQVDQASSLAKAAKNKKIIQSLSSKKSK